MTKGEMQVHQDLYHSSIAKARLEYKSGRYREALQCAMRSWSHINGMMQYERKYEGRESFSIEGILMVINLAPLLLDLESLNGLEALLKNERRIVKSTTEDVASQLSDARDAVWDAHRLWDFLEGHAGVRQDELRLHLGETEQKWESLTATWETMGFILRVPECGSYRLSLATQLDLQTLGKCPECAAVAAAPKSVFLQKVECPTCHSDVEFVLLGDA